MKFNGFNSYHKNGQFIIDLIMPEELKGIFQASMYARGAVMDAADGDPERIWDNMSYNYNNVKLVAPQQIHGTDIISADKEYSLPFRPEADGVLIKENSECLASLRFADCTPVIVSGIDPKPWMLILHSGFVGTMKNITFKSISNLHSQFTPNFKDKIWAWIGPGICRKCYSRKKDDPTTESAMKIFSALNYYEKDNLIYFDIQKQIKEQLIYSCVPCSNIFIFDSCTYCSSDLFYSYRGGDTKRRIFLLAGNTTK